MVFYKCMSDILWDAACEVYREYVYYGTVFEVWQLGAGPYYLIPSDLSNGLPNSPKAKLRYIARLAKNSNDSLAWEIEKIGGLPENILMDLERSLNLEN